MTRKKSKQTASGITVLAGKLPASILIVAILTFSAEFRSSSQTKEEIINKGISQIYNVKFDSALSTFSILISQDPKDPTGYFFLSMTEWWRININKEGEKNFENYLKRTDECIKVCDERIDRNENDEWAIFLKGGVIGYRGFLNALRDNWLSAVDDGREGLRLIERANEINPNNKDAIFGIGIYNYAVEYVKKKYPFLKTLLFFFPDGNKELGLSQLRDCSENAKYSKDEALQVLSYVNLVYEKNFPESEKYATLLVRKYPDNSLFEKFLARSYVGQGRFYESINNWKSIISKSDSNKAGYNNKHIRRESFYYLGLSYLKINNTDTAIIHYEKSYSLCKELDTEKESVYQVFTVLGLAMAYDKKGIESEADKYYDMVMNMKDIDNSVETAKLYKEKRYN